MGLDEDSIKELEADAEKAAELAGEKYDVAKDVNYVLKVILKIAARGYPTDFHIDSNPGPDDIYATGKRSEPMHPEVFESEIISRLGVDIAEVEKAKAEWQAEMDKFTEYKRTHKDTWGDPDVPPYPKSIQFSTKVSGLSVLVIGSSKDHAKAGIMLSNKGEKM